MKNPENSQSESSPLENIKWVDYQNFRMDPPEERFEHWGYWVYTELTSRLISWALVSRVVEN